jgi:hypothetical protein
MVSGRQTSATIWRRRGVASTIMIPLCPLD